MAAPAPAQELQQLRQTVAQALAAGNGRMTSDVRAALAEEGKRLQSDARAALVSVTRERDSLAELYQRESAERRRLFNLVQELRGNIRVFCRVRPVIAQEREMGEEVRACVLA